MMKRALDVTASFLGLLIFSPLLLPVLFLIWIHDRGSPFYIAPRVGKGGRLFNMVKLRSMVVGADQTGVDSTSATDQRITAVGKFIRAYKLDELIQLWNVLTGDMSLVGPRPNVKRGGTDLYTEEERRLLSVKPGITDISSIVFADEGEILRGSANPDLDYNQRIRPWKSRLGLLYVDRRSFKVDLFLIYLTVIALISRSKALQGIQDLLNQLQADETLKKVTCRRGELGAAPPPGSNEIVRAL